MRTPTVQKKVAHAATDGSWPPTARGLQRTRNMRAGIFITRARLWFTTKTKANNSQTACDKQAVRQHRMNASFELRLARQSPRSMHQRRIRIRLPRMSVDTRRTQCRHQFAASPRGSHRRKARFSVNFRRTTPPSDGVSIAHTKTVNRFTILQPTACHSAFTNLESSINTN